MDSIHPLENAGVTEDVSRLRGRRRLDGAEADGAEGGGLRSWCGDREDGEVGGGRDGGSWFVWLGG